MKKIIIILITALLLPVNVLAEKLDFAVVEWPPLVILENEQIKGISVDITREACNRLGITAEFQVLPLKRAVKYLKDGKVCMASLFYNKERAEFLYYPSEYQYKTIHVIAALKENKINVNSLDDLKDKTIGIIDGYYYGKEFTEHPDLKKSSLRSIDKVILLLEKGRIDAGAVEENGFKFICKQLGKLDKFKIIYTISEKPFYTVFPKKMGKRGLELSEKFSTTLKQMRDEGLIQQIVDRYTK